MFVAAVGCGIAFGHLQWMAPLSLAALWWVAYRAKHASTSTRAALWTLAAALSALGLALHLFPGFINPIVAAGVRFGDATVPVTLRANFDKGAAGLLLLAYCCLLIERAREWPRTAAVGLSTGVVTAAVVIGLAATMGLVQFDPKWHSLGWVALSINLFFTCVAEEAFFRGVVQQKLADALRDHSRWRWLPIAAASVLFGVAHAGGGAMLVVCATLAGIGYGWAYAATRRIEAAVLAHFTLNAIHFVGFTYPFGAVAR